MANLSLNDMQYIINEASKMVLNEITVKDAYARFYKDIPTNHYESIISVIQTGGDDFNDGMVLSPESKWALAIYRKNPQQFLEDFYKLRNENGDGYLDIFVRAKERRIISGTEADLNQYKSIAELGHFVNSLDYERIMGRTKGEQSNAINAAADQADFPYEDEVWKVVIPHTYEASCYWGNGTEWCTATRETSKWYYRYTNDGPLYILINKESNDKFQFHFPSGQFMNEEDYEIDDPVLDTIRATEGLENFFKKAEPENFFSLFYQKLCKTPVLYLKCTDEGEYLLNDEGSEIAGPFDSIMGYNYGFNAKVEKDSYYNFINTRGEVILDEWFASVMYNSDSDTFRTTNNGDEYYLFTSKGKKVNEKPMRRIFSPSYGLAAVVDMHGNANYMKMSDGELIIFPEFEYEILKDTLPFMYQRGLVINHHGYTNIVDNEGNFLCDEWYKKIEYFHKSITDNFKCFFSVKNTDGLYNCLDYNGNVMYDKWFVGPVKEWFYLYGKQAPWANVKLEDGEWVRIDAMGNIYHGNKTNESKKMIGNILTEITVKDAYTKYYSDIPSRDYQRIYLMIQGDNDILLPETKWVLGLYKKKSPRLMEDLYKLKNERGDGYLDIFLRAKERRMISGAESDLNRFKSIAELGTYVSSLDVDTILGRTKGEMSNAVHGAKDDIEKLYEDEYWIVLIPKSHEASCYWAKGAHWCTAYRDSDDYFNEYSSEGPLFMNINKINIEKSSQFHFESDQFMDYYDEEIEMPILNNVGKENTALLKFYQSYLPKEQFMGLCADDLQCFSANRYAIRKDDGTYMIDDDFRIVAGPFEWIEEFNNETGFTRVHYEDGRMEVIDENGNNMLGEGCIPTSMGKAGVVFKESGDYYLRKNDGTIHDLSKYGYVETMGACSFLKVAIQKPGGKRFENVLDENLQEVFPWEYCRVGSSFLGKKRFFKIMNYDQRFNIADLNGNLLFDEWYRGISESTHIFNEPVFSLANEYVVNFARVNGEKVYDEDFIDFQFHVYNTRSGVVGICVLKNGQHCKVNKNFTLTPYNPDNFHESKLTPKDVMYIVEQTAKQLIKEIKVVDAYSAYYKDIPEDIFQKIVTTIQGNNDTLLPNTKWFLGMYRKSPDEAIRFLPNLRQEDGRGLLDTWERCVQRGVINGNQSNLSIYKTLDDWADFTYQIAVDNNVWNRSKGEWSKAVNSAKNDIEKVYEDENWFVIIPKSTDASCYWCNGTEWCTATRNEENNQFEFYSSQGPLYININKQTKEKYQFHFETHSFMNQKDEGIQKPVMEHIEGVTNGLCDFYREITKDDSMSNFFLFDYNINDETDWTWVSSMDESVAVIKIKDKGCNFFTDSEGVLSDRWFDSVSHPDDEIHFAKVYHNGGYDIFNLKERCLEFPSIAFDSIDNFNAYEDLDIFYAKAYKNNKVTLIFYLMNHNGYMTWLGRWFDWMEDFGDSPYGYLAVKNDEMWGYVNLDGEIIGDYYDGVWDWKNDYCKVENNGKYNFMNEQGDLISSVWFDECDDYINLQGKVNVEINGETLRFDVNDINDFDEDLWD